jgi:hypothetical protein
LEIIEINYSNEEFVRKNDKLLDQSLAQMNNEKFQEFYQNTKKLKPSRKLELGEFREVKNNKTKIITRELDKHKISSWSPNLASRDILSL